MNAFTASAPSKTILFGEHYVVYGSPALAIAIEPRNAVGFSDGKGNGALLESVLGKGRISPGGGYSGAPALSIYAEVAKTAFGSSPIPSCTVSFEPGWLLKGVGVSASLCAAFAAGLFRLKGEDADAERIFSAAQSGDIVAHGGRASGIDAKTVSAGGAITFQRKFSPPSFDFSPLKLSLPKGTSLLLIDTFSGRKSTTAEMVGAFAKSFGIAKQPQELGEDERGKVRGEYEAVWRGVADALGGENAKKLGSLMNENHALLKKRGVSSGGIEKAVSAALASGAYGAKLTAAGGEGGAVLALCGSKIGAAAASITSSTGFACHIVSLAKRGAAAD